MKTSVTALAALAQTSRLAIFRLLVERGPLGANPGEIAETLGVAPTTLSFHLKELVHAGLVHAEQLGRFIRYRADMPVMQSLIDYLTQNCCAGNPSLCAPLQVPGCAPSSKPATSKSAKTTALAARPRARAAKPARRVVR